MYAVNSNGPSTESCGTSNSTGVGEDSSIPIRTSCWRPEALKRSACDTKSVCESEGDKSDHLRQTPEIIADKIKKMIDNKSPGVDGIPPKLHKEIVEQISTPLAKLFNLSLEEGIVPSEWK